MRYGLSDIDVSVQSALLKLRIAFGEAVISPKNVMGSGLILTTSLGSTAMNRNFGGPSVDIRNNSITLTGIGTASPVGGFSPVVNHADTVFDIEVESQDKRPVIVTNDSFGVVKNESKSPVKSIRVSMENDKAVNLVLKDNPGLRAYAAIIP